MKTTLALLLVLVPVSASAQMDVAAWWDGLEDCDYKINAVNASWYLTDQHAVLAGYESRTGDGAAESKAQWCHSFANLGQAEQAAMRASVAKYLAANADEPDEWWANLPGATHPNGTVFAQLGRVVAIGYDDDMIDGNLPGEPGAAWSALPADLRVRARSSYNALMDIAPTPALPAAGAAVLALLLAWRGRRLSR